MSGGSRSGASRARRAAVVGAVYLALLIAGALLAPVVAPYDPIKQDLARMLTAPSSAHLLGTDDLGRDVLTRLLYGARLSLGAACLAVAIATLARRAHRPRRGLPGRGRRRRADAGDRRAPGLPGPDPGHGHRGRARPRALQRDGRGRHRLHARASPASCAGRCSRSARSRSWRARAPRAPATGACSAATCCRTCSRRSSCRCRSASRSRCWPRPRCRSWAWASSPPSPRGAPTSAAATASCGWRRGSSSCREPRSCSTALAFNLVGDGIRDAFDPRQSREA